MIFSIWADQAHVRELGLAEALLATSCRTDRLNCRQPDSDQEPELQETDQESERRGNVPELPVAETI